MGWKPLIVCRFDGHFIEDTISVQHLLSTLPLRMSNSVNCKQNSCRGKPLMDTKKRNHNSQIKVFKYGEWVMVTSLNWIV